MRHGQFVPCKHVSNTHVTDWLRGQSADDPGEWRQPDGVPPQAVGPGTPSGFDILVFTGESRLVHRACRGPYDAHELPRVQDVYTDMWNF